MHVSVIQLLLWELPVHGCFPRASHLQFLITDQNLEVGSSGTGDQCDYVE